MPECLAVFFDVYVNVRNILHTAKVKLFPSRFITSYHNAVTADWLALGFQK